MKAVRNTRQKQVIAAAVAELDHPTASDVFRRARESVSDISLGTVYRVLSNMADGGLVRRVSFSYGEDIFDKTLKPHCHIRCRRCGRVRDVRLNDGPVWENMVSDAGDFTVESSHIEFTGVCGECRRLCE